MLATPGQSVPTGPDWQFEVKHDGYRMIARAENGKAYLEPVGPALDSLAHRVAAGI